MVDSLKRVLVVDDHEVVGEGLRSLLSPYFEILGPIRDGNLVIGAVKQHHPDAMVLDISLPGRSGLDLLPELHLNWPHLAIVMLTGSADFLVGRTALSLGALGFLPKDSGHDELVLALRTALSGRQYLSPRLTLPARSSTAGALPLNASHLTPRQLVILQLIGNGAATEQIAEALGVSPHTVHFHRRNLRRALGIDSDSGLVRIATLFKVRKDFE